MPSISAVDARTGRKFFLDDPDDLRPGEELTFLLNLHGGGSVGQWQRAYFPAHDHKERHRLVVATPSAATKEPFRHWTGEADDAHLQSVVEHVLAHYGVQRVRAFWLVGHSQGGFTAQRLLNTPYFAARVDGWLSLSGGRIGAAERAPNAGPPGRAGTSLARRVLERPPVPACDFSHIFAVGEHEIAKLPDTSPWAEKYGAGPRMRLPDVADVEPGQIHDGRYDEKTQTREWGRQPAPGTAQLWLYPNARDGRVIADCVRLDKGHTEGLEPRVTDALIQLMVRASGGKARAL